MADGFSAKANQTSIKQACSVRAEQAPYRAMFGFELDPDFLQQVDRQHTACGNNRRVVR
jgi:hypothetical protein